MRREMKNELNKNNKRTTTRTAIYFYYLRFFLEFFDRLKSRIAYAVAHILMNDAKRILRFSNLRLSGVWMHECVSYQSQP